MKMWILGFSALSACWQREPSVADRDVCGREGELSVGRVVKTRQGRQGQVLELNGSLRSQGLVGVQFLYVLEGDCGEDILKGEELLVNGQIVPLGPVVTCDQFMSRSSYEAGGGRFDALLQRCGFTEEDLSHLQRLRPRSGCQRL